MIGNGGEAKSFYGLDIYNLVADTTATQITYMESIIPNVDYYYLTLHNTENPIRL